MFQMKITGLQQTTNKDTTILVQLQGEQGHCSLSVSEEFGKTLRIGDIFSLLPRLPDYA